MKRSSPKDNNPSVFYSEEIMRLHNAILQTNEHATVWSSEGYYQIFALQEHMELLYGDKNENFNTYPAKVALVPSQDKAIFCSNKQPPSKACVGKTADSIPVPPPPGFFVCSSSLCCRSCVTYNNNAKVECSPQHPDELDVNGIIREFQANNWMQEESSGNDTNAGSSKERIFNLDVAHKLLETSYVLFNIFAEEVCFNDKLIKELCLRYVHLSKVKKRMSYTNFLTET